MTKDEARRILDVAPNAKRPEINAAYNTLRCKYVTKSQYSPDPHQRKMASNALILLQDAYRALPGRLAPAQSHCCSATTTVPQASIPRASLGGAPAQHHASSRGRPRTTASTARSSTPKRCASADRGRFRTASTGKQPVSRENKMAFVICTAMYMLALLILAKVWACIP